ncbi:MAG: helix-turn-helix transcriptional regulator [Clostridia bacterium]|nr:helix-turn-helix transcriptional regulator [Clostridia bacterium]
MKLNSIGKYVRESRIAKGLRQEDLAEMIDLSSVYVGMLERGEKVASLETLVKIANALDVSSDYLLCEVLNHGNKVKDSVLNEKLDSVCDEDRVKIYDVIDTMISHSKKKLK